MGGFRGIKGAFGRMVDTVETSREELEKYNEGIDP